MSDPEEMDKFTVLGLSCDIAGGLMGMRFANSTLERRSRFKIALLLG